MADDENKARTSEVRESELQKLEEFRMRTVIDAFGKLYEYTEKLINGDDGELGEFAKDLGVPVAALQVEMNRHASADWLTHFEDIKELVSNRTAWGIMKQRCAAAGDAGEE